MNAVRHSFASYYLAKFQDAPALALQMGHTTKRQIHDCVKKSPLTANRLTVASSWMAKPGLTLSGSEASGANRLGNEKLTALRRHAIFD